MRFHFPTLAVVALLACSTGDDARTATRLSRTEFVRVMADLQLAERTPEARAAVLKKHAVTVEELREFVRVNAHDVAELKLVFDSVQAALDETPR